MVFRDFVKVETLCLERIKTDPVRSFRNKGTLRQFPDGRVLSRAAAVSKATITMHAENMLSAFFRGEPTSELYNSWPEICPCYPSV